MQEIHPNRVSKQRLTEAAVRPPYSLTLNMILGIACALLMFQLYVIATLIPEYNREFRSSLMHMAIPAFAIPFAFVAAGTAFFTSAVLNPGKLFSFSLFALAAGCILLSFARSGEAFFANRILTGLATGTLLPSAFIMATRSVENRHAFKNLAVIIFFMATGMTFAPSTGGWLYGSFGWRSIYQVMGLAVMILWFGYLWFRYRQRDLFYRQPKMIKAASGSQVISAGWQIYSFVYLSGVFHSGVFVWIIYHFSTSYHLGTVDLATVLIIFGLPGLAITVYMFSFHLDSKVVGLLYSGLVITAAGLAFMLADPDLFLAEWALALMSVGYCISQPLFLGIIKMPEGGVSTGRLIALGCGILFFGYGTGPLMMSTMLGTGKTAAMVFLVMLIAAIVTLSRKIWHRSHLSA